MVTQDQQEAGVGPGGCPALSVDIGQPGPILSHFEDWDRLREQYAAFWSDLYGGHWVVTRFDAIRHALQEPATFSNQSTIVSDPNPSYTFIPTFLDPPARRRAMPRRRPSRPFPIRPRFLLGDGPER